MEKDSEQSFTPSVYVGSRTPKEPLKPCAHCGGQGHLVEAVSRWLVWCEDCPEEVAGETEAEVVAAWQRRVWDNDTVSALLAACEACVAYGDRGEGRGRDAVDMARAAIARARGNTADANP
jgi:hypothetical protein